MSTQVESATRVIAEALNFDVNAYSPIPDVVASVAIVDPSEILFISLGLYLSVSISLIGLFYMISRRGNIFTFSFALISAIPFIVYVLLYLLSGFVYDESFNPLLDRWVYLTEILMCVPLAFSIYSIGTYKIRNVNYLTFFFGGVVILLSVSMIMTPSGSLDNHTLTPSHQYWSYYADSEMAGNDFFASKSIGVLSSDRNHAVHLSSSVFMHIYGFESDRLHMLDFEIQSGTFEHDNSIKIFRSKRILEFQRVGAISPEIQPDLYTYMSNCGFNKIYENPTMKGYTDIPQ